ncbi:uncharacterized protein TNCV_4311861 [Trichonephila clavipes]|nr:uncharacterized protein TNCV_4311861 [Trichonephila clavipes]
MSPKRLITSRLTGVGSFLPPVFSEAWAKGNGKDLFERQLTFLKVPIQQWVVYLVGLLPTEVSNLITKESFADAQDYYKVKQILLKRFKLSAENFGRCFPDTLKIL